jgi:hypothetical protein
MIERERLPDYVTTEVGMKLFERKQAWLANQLKLEAEALRNKKAEWLLERLRENPAMTGEGMLSLSVRFDQALTLAGVE